MTAHQMCCPTCHGAGVITRPNNAASPHGFTAAVAVASSSDAFGDVRDGDEVTGAATESSRASHDAAPTDDQPLDGGSSPSTSSTPAKPNAAGSDPAASELRAS